MNTAQIHTDYAWSWLILGILLAAGLAIFYYHREKRFQGVHRGWLITMGFLRFSGLSLLFLLLLGINFQQTQNQSEATIVAVVQDNSTSVIPAQDSQNFVKNYPAKLKKLGAAIDQQYDVAYYHFDQILRDRLSDSINGKSTNIGNVFKTLYNKYANRNLGAVVLASDGNYNAGIQPLIPLKKLANVPIYSIALGDTSAKKDIRVSDIEHNEVAFYQNEFPIKVFLEAEQIEAPKKVNVTIKKAGEPITQKEVKFKQSNTFTTINFKITADEMGVQKYDIVLDTLGSEWSTANNKRSFYIEVIDARQSILLTGAAPHPDISTIYQSLRKKKGYDMEIATAGEQPKKAISAYDLVILHNPTKRAIDEQIMKEAQALWIIAGGDADFSAINTIDLGFKMRNVRGSDNVFASIKSDFQPFQPEEDFMNLNQKLPPLASPFGRIATSNATKVLAHQRLGNIVKDDPLWFSNTINNRKIGVLLGTGIWRWQLYNQKFLSSTEQVENIIGQWTQYLALKTNKSKFRLQVQASYSDQEAIKIMGELYNEAFELSTAGEIRLNLKSNSWERTYDMLPFDKRYKSKIGQLKPGTYQWDASAKLKGKTYTKKGTFIVKKTYKEAQDYKADHQMLRNIAQQSGGAVVNYSEAEKINDLLREREDVSSVVHQKFSWQNLLDHWWWMLTVALIFCAEWFLRKRLGAI